MAKPAVHIRQHPSTHRRLGENALFHSNYRSDKIRNTPGVGLGLNLVAAIVRLHGFRLAIRPGPGGLMEILCPDR